MFFKKSVDGVQILVAFLGRGIQWFVGFFVVLFGSSELIFYLCQQEFKRTIKYVIMIANFLLFWL